MKDEEEELIMAICILAGSVISASHSKHEEQHHKDVIKHAKKFMKEIHRPSRK